MVGNPKPLTPLRYPGGKGAFSPFVKSVIETNHLKGGHYMEPFAGGAGVALDLLFNGYVSDIHINDADLAIYHFWHAIVTNTDDFLALLQQAPLTIKEWEKQKLILKHPENYSDLEHGFATFYLNRTNHSGILKAGVIGGKAQNGTYKLDARFNKVRLSNLIKRIANYANNIHVYNLDALELLGKADQILPSPALIYLDPPYYIKGHRLYRNFYNHDDHVQICDALGTIKTPWIVSYDNCNEIKSIYKNYYQEEYILSYCAYKRIKGSEVMIYGKNVLRPNSKL